MASFAPPFAFEVYTLSRPVIVVHIFLTALRILAGIQFAPWIRILALASAIPANFFLTLYTEDRRERARARMRGAELPPFVSYKWPGGLDLLAEMRKMEKRKAYISERIATWMDDLGQTIQIYTMFERRIATTEPAYIKAVLSTEFTNFEKGKLAGSQLASILGDGVFNSDGDLWKFHRSMTRPFFSRDRISHFDIFNRHVDVALEHMKTRLREGYALDMQDLVSRFTLDSATEFLFGKDVQSLSAGLPYPSIGCVSASANWLNPQHPANRFPKAFSQAQVQGAMRLRLGSLWRWFELSGDKTKEHMRIIDAFVEPILSDAIRKNKATSNPASAGNGDEDSETLLDHLVKFVVEHKALKDEIVNIMIAGRDTTAATLTFVVYMLSQHPDVAERLYEEIQTKLPNSRCPTFDDLRDMKYLRAVINETLRLYPPVPFNMRRAINDTVWPSATPGGKPLFVPAGTRVDFSMFLMHRRADLWGPVLNPFIFLPFSAGPRICLGQQFAYNEISFMLVRLLQTFTDIKLAPDAQPPASHPPPDWAQRSGRESVEKIRMKSHLTMYAMDGLWVRMSERQNEDAQGIVNEN